MWRHFRLFWPFNALLGPPILSLGQLFVESTAAFQKSKQKTVCVEIVGSMLVIFFRKSNSLVIQLNYSKIKIYFKVWIIAIKLSIPQEMLWQNILHKFLQFLCAMKKLNKNDIDINCEVLVPIFYSSEGHAYLLKIQHQISFLKLVLLYILTLGIRKLKIG